MTKSKMQKAYVQRGLGNQTAVILCPNVVGNHLVHFNHRFGSWVIRDYIKNYRLESGDDSSLTVEQIEEDAVYAEAPPWRRVESSVWETYLRTRYSAIPELLDKKHLGYGRIKPWIGPEPNPASGKWKLLVKPETIVEPVTMNDPASALSKLSDPEMIDVLRFLYHPRFHKLIKTVAGRTGKSLGYVQRVIQGQCRSEEIDLAFATEFRARITNGWRL